MSEHVFAAVMEYLANKGIKFYGKVTYKNNIPHERTIMGVSVKYDGRNFWANGKIISRQIARYLIK